MTCNEARGLSSDYLDQRLSPMNIALVEEHLKICQDCSREFDELNRTISLIGSLEEIETSPGFLARVNRKIAEREKTRRLWQWFFEPLRIKVPLQAAALCLVSLIGFFLYHRSPELARYRAVEEAEDRVSTGEQEISQEPLEKKQRRLDETAARKEPAVPEKEKREIAPSAPVTPGAAPGPSAAPASRPDSVASNAAPGTATAAAPRPEVVELLVEDVDRSEREVRVLLEQVAGRVLIEEGSPGSAVLLTLEVPQSRRAEFLAALRQEPEGGQLRGPKDRSAASRERAAQESSPGVEEPMARLHLRILPKK
jgi:hypothetical protein